MISDRTYPLVRQNFGNQRSRGAARHIFGLSYGYTNNERRAGAGASGTVFPITAVPTAGTTFHTGFTAPDVPRAVSVAINATTPADIAAGTITVTGTNVEGKVITETFTVTADTAATLTGAKAFKTVTGLTVPVQDGSSVTVSVGTRNMIGLNHRLPTGTTTANVRIVTTSNVSNMVLTSGSATTSNLGANGIKTVQSVPSAITVDPALIELNTATPASLPDGTFHMSIHYYYVKWNLDPINDLTKVANTTNYGAE